MKKFYFFVFLLFVQTTFLFSFAQAQNARLGGKIADKKTTNLMAGVDIVLTNISDKTDKHFAVSDNNGDFMVTGLTLQKSYELKATLIGYSDIRRTVFIKTKTENIGLLMMSEQVKSIKGIEVTGQIPVAQQKGDTTELNANAFKTNPDAVAEDLVKKMPGITVENGTVKAHGEEVKKVYVDGKTFFGDDPTVAMKNLPADIIDKVQIFNKLSDQSELTGFDDGQSSKALNFITKKDRRNGMFGKFFAGHSYDDKYNLGGNYNWFNGDRRITILGLSNNVNQQNFATQDFLGAMNGPPQIGMGGGGRNSRGGAGMPGFIGQQNGITSNNSIGINYSDNWGKKINVSGSYFFNSSKNNTNQLLNRQYLLSADSSQYYTENSKYHNNNSNHRFDMRIEYAIDSSNTIMFMPRLNLQDNSSSNILSGSNTLAGGEILNQSNTVTTTKSFGYNYGSDLMYRHKFGKKGRTFSIGLSASGNEKDPKTTQNGSTIIGGENTIIHQRSTSDNNGSTVSSNLVYTEPFLKNGLIQLNYNISYNSNTTNKKTYSIDSLTGSEVLDTMLTNNYQNNYLTHRGGIGYRLKGDKYNLITNIGFQETALDGKQVFPLHSTVNKTFDNILPSLIFNYKFSQKNNLRIMYRTSTNIPSVSQLQDVVDNSNLLLLTTGNPELKQEYSHMLMANYSFANVEKSRNYFLFLYAGYKQNNISDATYIATHDTLIGNIALQKGAQLTRPVNLDHSWNLRSMMTYGFPVNFIKSSLNITGGFTYTQSPGIINGKSNISNAYNYNGGLILSSNISQNVDFTLSYNANYYEGFNSLQTQNNSHYWNQSAGCRFNWIIWNGFFVQNDVTGQFYNGLSGGYNTNYVLWNAGVGKKFLKNQKGELRLSVYDILNQNTNVSRTYSETYIQDTKVNTLKQYFMLTFTFSFSKGAVPEMRRNHHGDRPDLREGPPPGKMDGSSPPPPPPMDGSGPPPQ